MKKFKGSGKQRSPITGLQKPKQIKRPVVKKKREFRLFKGKEKTFKKEKFKRRGRNIGVKILGIFIVLIVLGLVGISIKYVLSTRGNTNDDMEEGYVLGIEEVPVYPDSVFLFENDKENDTVQDFLMSGQSAYRLPGNTDREDVNNYYSSVLPELGWTNVLSVPIGTEDKRYGEYWTKGDEGLRIYVKETSIWYELISVTDAQTGLSAEVAEEIERELLLASSETQDLLPDFSWVLDVPKEYLITYSSTDIEDYRAVSFKKIGTNTVYSITPAGYYGDDTYDGFLYEYIDSKNTTDVEEWGIQDTYYKTINGKKYLFADIISPEGITEAAVLNNTFDGLVYIFLSSPEDEEDMFFEYILENIKALENHST
jgi:hypothetical protein